MPPSVDAGLSIVLLREFEHLRVGCLASNPAVGCIELSRPERSNAFNEKMLCVELPQAVQALDQAADVRVVLLVAAGRNFCAGIDIAYLKQVVGAAQSSPDACPGLVREAVRANVLRMQDAISSLERCRHPVIAAVQGACVGGGVDLITACDMRICSEDAAFCVKEVDLAIVADLGTLQRLPHIVGHGVAMDLALTASNIGAARALHLNLVTQVVAGAGPGPLRTAAVALATALATKPALAMRGTKRVLLHARDHGGVSANLDYVATYNSGVLLNADLHKMVQAASAAGGVRRAKL